MHSSHIRGSLVALVTPFKEDGSIDYVAYEKLIKLHISAKTDGLVLCGTSGEAATMTLEEKKSLLKIAKELTNSSIPLIFGTGGNDTKTVCDLTSKAESFGADAVLIVTPYYNKPPQEGLIRHFTLAANSTALPVILYNVPGRTGCNMLPETVLKLSEISNIIGVKEASGNLSQVMAIIKDAPKDFCLYSGEDALNLPIMMCGGKGTISVTANVAPKMMKQFNDAALSGDLNTAQKLHYRLLPMHHGLFVETNPIPAKAALKIMGLMSDFCRSPLCKPSEKTTLLMSKLISSLEQSN